MKKLIFSALILILSTPVALADGILINWGEANVIGIPVYEATTGVGRQEAPTLADGDCTLWIDGTESAPTLTWNDTGNITEINLSATDSEMTHGVISCEDQTNPATYLAFTLHFSPRIVPSGTAQGGAASSITFATTDSASNDAYNNQTVIILDGPGLPKVNCVTDYVGSTKVATVKNAWAQTPTSSTVYARVADYCE